MKYTVAQSRNPSMAFSVSTEARWTVQDGHAMTVCGLLRGPEARRRMLLGVQGCCWPFTCSMAKGYSQCLAGAAGLQAWQLRASTQTWSAGCTYCCLSLFSCCHSCCTRRFTACTASAPCWLCRRAAANRKRACSGPREAGCTSQMPSHLDSHTLHTPNGAGLSCGCRCLCRTVLLGWRTERCAGRPSHSCQRRG